MNACIIRSVKDGVSLKKIKSDRTTRSYVQYFAMSLQHMHYRCPAVRYLGHLFVDVGQLVQHLLYLQGQRLEDMVPQQRGRVRVARRRNRGAGRPYADFIKSDQLHVDVVLQMASLFP